jgi:hypothetical protein
LYGDTQADHSSDHLPLRTLRLSVAKAVESHAPALPSLQVRAVERRQKVMPAEVETRISPKFIERQDAYQRSLERPPSSDSAFRKESTCGYITRFAPYKGCRCDPPTSGFCEVCWERYEQDTTPGKWWVSRGLVEAGTNLRDWLRAEGIEKPDRPSIYYFARLAGIIGAPSRQVGASTLPVVSPKEKRYELFHGLYPSAREGPQKIVKAKVVEYRPCLRAIAYLLGDVNDAPPQAEDFPEELGIRTRVSKYIAKLQKAGASNRVINSALLKCSNPTCNLPLPSYGVATREPTVYDTTPLPIPKTPTVTVKDRLQYGELSVSKILTQPGHCWYCGFPIL